MHMGDSHPPPTPSTERLSCTFSHVFILSESLAHRALSFSTDTKSKTRGSCQYRVLLYQSRSLIRRAHTHARQRSLSLKPPTDPHSSSHHAKQSLILRLFLLFFHVFDLLLLVSYTDHTLLDKRQLVFAFSFAPEPPPHPTNASTSTTFPSALCVCRA